MSEDKTPNGPEMLPEYVEDDVEVVAHGTGTDDVCIINNSHSLYPTDEDTTEA